MKSKNRKDKLYRRQRDHAAGPKGNDRSKHVEWSDGERAAFHKPGSNKK